MLWKSGQRKKEDLIISFLRPIARKTHNTYRSHNAIWENQFVLGFFGGSIIRLADITPGKNFSRLNQGTLLVNIFDALTEGDGYNAANRQINFCRRDPIPELTFLGIENATKVWDIMIPKGSIPKTNVKGTYSAVLDEFFFNPLVEILRGPQETEEASANKFINDVEALMQHLGYKLTPYGVAVALISKASGYTAEETVSNLSVISFARDVKVADAIPDLELRGKLLMVGYCILENIKVFRDNGLMRDVLWRNDANAIGNIMELSSETDTWIDKVLSDPVGGKEPVSMNTVISVPQSKTQ